MHRLLDNTIQLDTDVGIDIHNTHFVLYKVASGIDDNQRDFDFLRAVY